VKKQKQSTSFDLDQLPVIPVGKAAPVIKKPFRQRAAEWMHIQSETFRRRREQRRREREKKRSIRPAAPSVGQLERELARERKRARRMSMLRRALAAVLGLALLAAAAVVWFPVTIIAGDAMSPALCSGEAVLSVRTQALKPGDLVLFAGAQGQTWIKRVIAFAGDEVNILSDGTVTVNGCVLDEPYASFRTRGDCDIEFPYRVPHGRIFVLGDHRMLSVDSRHAIPGCIPQEQIIGRVEWRIWPVDRMGSVNP